jgi:hypothetical protein
VKKVLKRRVVCRRVVVNKVVVNLEEGIRRKVFRERWGRRMRDGRESRAFLKGLIL